jgi:hypothetical protein
LFSIFAIAIPLDIPAGMSTADGAAMRIALDLKGKISAAAIPPGVTLPEGTDAEKIFGGEHFPVLVRVTVDGKQVFEKTYQPSGVSGNGRISALEFLPLTAGSHQIEILLKDDGNDFRTVFSDEVVFDVSQVIVFHYSDKSNTIEIR